MRKKTTRKILVFFLLLAATAVCAMSACDSRALRSDQREIHSASEQVPPVNSEQQPVATKTVNHILGQTEIPVDPQRIVVLDATSEFLLDGLLALGLKPVGLTRCPSCMNSDPFSEILGGLPNIGTDEQPSLERILKLKPDLILGYEWQESFYSQLSEIAPTVIVNPYAGGNDFKRNFRQLAEILGKSDEVDSILAEYNERIQNFRQRFGEKLRNKTVSLLTFSSSGFHVHGPEYLFIARVMSDAGIQFIPAYKALKDGGQLNMSIEVLPNWDADFLFMELFQKDSLEEFESVVVKQPLWFTLKAVRNDQVYIITKYPSGGPIGASQFIDDLSEYFSSKL
ncbi:MAG: iron-siderophore ABC transporter substrate-binding protein [Cyanobacteria bacterium P01_H01_bin.21]